MVGIAQSVANLAVYSHRGSFDYFNTLGLNLLKVSAVWGWCMFAINTALTAAIMGKILYVSGSVHIQLVVF